MSLWKLESSVNGGATVDCRTLSSSSSSSSSAPPCFRTSRALGLPLVGVLALNVHPVMDNKKIGVTML
jgi:hypothetical protein